MRTAFLLLIVSGLSCCVMIEAAVRTWTDATGKFRVEAELVKVDKGTVVLRKATGQEIAVPLAKLSAADQEFLRSTDSGAPRTSEGVVNHSAASSAKPTTTDSKSLLAVLEKQANIQRTAADAAKLYSTYLAESTLGNERPQLEERLKYWQQLSEKQSVRMGDKWVSLQEAKQIEAAEEQLIAEADRMFEVDNLELAMERLRKASQANPQSIKGDFIIGLVQGLVFRSATDAEKHFAACVRRRQGNLAVLQNAERLNLVAAYNNLAIARVRAGDYRGALTAWQNALDLASPAAELVQNLGRLSELPQTHPYLDISPSTARAASDLYAKVAVASQTAKYNKRTGWLYMRYVVEPKSDDLLNNKNPAAPAIVPTTLKGVSGESTTVTGMVMVGGATGIVVAPKHVLTNRHVVENADSIQIVSPGDSPTPQRAAVFKVSQSHDLALLVCDALELPAVEFNSAPARLGSELMLLGYPEFMSLGQDLKVSKGIVSGMPNAANENMLLYDAVTNPGNSGGPVCDKSGAVIALHARGLGADAFQNANAGKLGAGIPAKQVLRFLTEASRKLEIADGQGSDLTWEQVVEKVGKSTVNILVYQNSEKLKFQKQLVEQRRGVNLSDKEWDALEDPWCMACNGTTKVDCPAQGCANGKIKSRSTEVIGTTASGRSLTRQKTGFDVCRNCTGAGKVRCPLCRLGVDPAVLGR